MQRLNARIDPVTAEQLDELVEATGQTVSAIVRDAVRAYHGIVARRVSPLEALSGFVACESGSSYLATRAKELLTDGLVDKNAAG